MSENTTPRDGVCGPCQGDQPAAEGAAAPRKTYKGANRATWCAGCGDYGVLASLDKALQAYGRPEWEIAVVSGIGCSSRFPYFMNTYGFHTVHGRALAVATGLKLARPELTVIATGGDGDAFAIGGNHFFHTMRRNVDMTYLVMDNAVYGMTKGQAAPTSRMGMNTKSTPFGTVESPVDPVWAALTMGATFVAQVGSFDPGQMTELILAALNHRGMAVVNCLSPCVTFNAGMSKEYIKDHSRQIPASHDPTDYVGALTMIRGSHDHFPLGLIYHSKEPTLQERIAAHAPAVAEQSIEAIAAEFL